MLALLFLNPGFALAGAALIALPILIHFLNRRRFRVIPWAAMDYLLSAMKKNRRRLKFEQWLLLALRCLILGLLGLALARPLGCGGGALAQMGRSVGLHVLILDNSYSMAYEADRPDAKTHLDQAKRIARSLVDQLSGDEAVVLITAAAPAQAVIATPAYDLDAVRSAIDRIPQTQAATDLPGALRLAQKIADDTPLPKRTLHLLTDGTRSAFEGQSDLPALAQQLAGQFRLVHHHLGKPGQWNQAVLGLAPVSPLVIRGFDTDFRATAKGFGPGPATTVQWTLDDTLLPGGGLLELDLDTPAPSRGVTFTDGGTHVLGLTIAADDRLKIDNIRRRSVLVASNLKTLIVEGYRGNGALEGSAAFLNLALAPPHEAITPGEQTASPINTEIISDIQLGNQVLTDYRAVILTNVARLSDTAAEQLALYVRGGGTLLMFMGDQVSTDSYNQSLLPRNLLPGPLVRQVNTPADQDGYQFDFTPANVRSRYLKVFENQPGSGLETARVYNYIQMALARDSVAERVLDFRSTSAASGGNVDAIDPAVTVHSLGDGRVVFFATTADPRWTSFPAKPAYVVLMHELLAGSIDAGDAWMNLEVGQSMTIPRQVKLTTTPTLTDSAGREIPLTAEADTYHSQPMDSTGVYKLNTGSATWPIVVNPPAQEADIRTMEPGAIRAAMGDVEIEMIDDAVMVTGKTDETGRDFGWPLLAMLAGVVATESVLAMRFGHNKK